MFVKRKRKKRKKERNQGPPFYSQEKERKSEKMNLRPSGKI